MVRAISLFLFAAVCAGAFALRAGAHEDGQYFVATPWQGPEMAQSRLIVAPGELSHEYAEGQGIVGGLQVKLQPGWFTYWRTPGESGLPPAFEWEDSVSVDSVRVLFPAPEHKVIDGVSVNGYSGDVVLPVVISPSRAHGAMTLRLKVRYAVCRDVCVPVEVVHVLDMRDASDPMSATGVVKVWDEGGAWMLRMAHLSALANHMAEWGEDFLDENISRIEEAAEHAARIAEREAERAAERAAREAERAQERAEQQAEAVQEQAQEEAETTREAAQAEAEAVAEKAREEAQEQADKAREIAQEQAEKAREEGARARELAEEAREQAQEAREQARREVERALELLQEALARVPDENIAAVTIRTISANVVEANGRRTLTIRIKSNNPFSAPQAFVEGPGLVIFGGATTEISDEGHTLTIVAPISRTKGVAIDGRWVTVTVVDGKLVFEERLKVSPRSPVAMPWTPEIPTAQDLPDVPLPPDAPEPPAPPAPPPPPETRHLAIH